MDWIEIVGGPVSKDNFYFYTEILGGFIFVCFIFFLISPPFLEAQWPSEKNPKMSDSVVVTFISLFS